MNGFNKVEIFDSIYTPDYASIFKKGITKLIEKASNADGDDVLKVFERSQ